MAEVYTPQTWADGAAGGTPITAARLQHIENGLEALDDARQALETALSASQATLPVLIGAPSPQGLAFAMQSSPFGIDGTGRWYYLAAGVPQADMAYPVPQEDGTVRLVKIQPIGGVAQDLTAPIISGVTASAITRIGATIAATTDEPARVVVQYGTTNTYGTNLAPTLLATSHTIPIPGLTAGTLYHYRLRATDAAGNERVDIDRTFTTEAAAPAAQSLGSNYNPPTTFDWVRTMFGADTTGADQYVEFDVVGLTDNDKNAGGIFRYTSGTQHLRAAFRRTTYSVFALGYSLDINGTWAGTSTGSGKARIELIGQTVVFYWNGARVATVDAGTGAAGLPGKGIGVTVWQNAANAVTISGATAGTPASAVAPPPDAAAPAAGQPGHKAVALFGPTLSGLPWHSGAFTGGGIGTVRQNYWGTWRGRPGDSATTRPVHETWASITNSDWAIGLLDGFPGLINYGLPMLPTDRAGQWTDITTGSRDAVFQTLAQQAIAHNRGNTLWRIGPGANSLGQPWSVTWNTSIVFIDAFRRIVNIMRSYSPAFRFAVSYTAGAGLSGKPATASRIAEIERLYPGDDVTDIIETVHYDAFNLTARNETEWTAAIRPPSGAGMADLADYARSRNKGWAVGEWALHQIQGAGDNPFFMEKMWALFNTYSDVLAHEAYYNERDPYIRSSIWDTEPQNPNSAVVYRNRWGGIVAAGATDTPLGLPAKVRAGYWMKWADSNQPRLADIPIGYNTIFLAFAQQVAGSGAVQWSQTVQSNASFLADVTTCRNRGQRIVLSIGGGGSAIDISDNTKRQQFFDSLVAIRAQFPFDGIDWDIEAASTQQTNFVTNLVWISSQCKTTFGSAFSITLAPTPGTGTTEYRTAASQLQTAGHLDMIAPHFYGGSVTQAQRRTDTAVSINEMKTIYGIPENKIGVGMRVHNDAGQYQADAGASAYWSIPGGVAAVTQYKIDFPALRGYYLWEIGTDVRLGNRWVNEVAALL